MFTRCMYNYSCDSKTSLTLQNGTQYLAEYGRYVSASKFNLSTTVYSQQCYDAMWALAYALNDTLTGETSATCTIMHGVPNIISDGSPMT